MAFESISAQQASELIAEDDAVVVDIRDQASFESGHIEAAIHLDNSNVESFIEQADLDRPLIVYCYHGNMSKGAADFLNSRGFSRTYSLDGGYSAWPGRQD